MNTWPNGKRQALNQRQHEAWNASNYPGTLQICVLCSDPTGYCEEDGYYDENGDPLCQPCALKRWYCETCGTHIPGEHVTNEETHDPGFDGCGDRVSPG